MAGQENYQERLTEFCAAHGLTRREFMRLFGVGAGALAAAGLAPQLVAAAPNSPPEPEFRPRNKGRQPTGTLTIMEGATPNNLDPLLRNAVPEFTINVHVYDMFLNRDAKTLQPIPNIVRTWENIDPYTWEMKLAPNARFHDGTPVNSEAAKFSLDRQKQEKVGNAARVSSFVPLTNYDTTEVVDDLTFRVKTKTPSPVVPDILLSVEIVPPSYFKDESEENLQRIATRPMGSGPYVFKEWVKGDHITLEANKDYWNGPPAFDTLIFKPVPELSTRILALTSGQADVITNVAPDLVDQVNASGAARVSQVTGGRIIFVGIRTDKPYFSDKRVRQALNYTVNFDAIKRALLNGSGDRAKSPVNPPHQNPALSPYPYDVDKAKQLLSEAGVPSGLSVGMMAPSGRYIKDKEMAQALAQNWQRQLGLNIELQVLDWSLYAGSILPSREPAELYFLGLGSSFDGQTELNYIHPNYSLNYTRWSNNEWTSLFEELKGTIGEDARLKIMYRLQEIMWDEVPWVYVWHQVDSYGVSNRIDWEARADERIYLYDSKWR